MMLIIKFIEIGQEMPELANHSNLNAIPICLPDQYHQVHSSQGGDSKNSKFAIHIYMYSSRMPINSKNVDKAYAYLLSYIIIVNLLLT